MAADNCIDSILAELEDDEKPFQITFSAREERRILKSLAADSEKYVRTFYKEGLKRLRAGELLTCLKLAKSENDIFGFWRWFKIYEITFCEGLGFTSGMTVNGISVYETDFEDLVISSIEQVGRIEKNPNGKTEIVIEKKSEY